MNKFYKIENDEGKIYSLNLNLIEYVKFDEKKYNITFHFANHNIKINCQNNVEYNIDKEKVLKMLGVENE